MKVATKFGKIALLTNILLVSTASLAGSSLIMITAIGWIWIDLDRVRKVWSPDASHRYDRNQYVG